MPSEMRYTTPPPDPGTTYASIGGPEPAEPEPKGWVARLRAFFDNF